MTKRIFRSIFLAAMTVVLAALILIMGAVHAQFTKAQTAQLHCETALAAHAVANEGLHFFENLGQLDHRITWIAADGTVLYDNRWDSDTMASHQQRREVADALATGRGQSVRYSDTLLRRYIYTAQLLPDGTVLRLAAVQDSVYSLALGMAQYIVLILAAASLFIFFMSRRMSRSIVQPINELNLDDPLSNDKYEEIQPLLQRLDSQQYQLRGQTVELKRRQKEFNTVTRSLSEGLVLMNSSGTILSINPAAARLLEVTPNCLGADFSVANRHEDIAVLVDRALAGEKAEGTVSLADGQYLAAASPVRSEGQIFGVVLLLFDVTQKHRAEQLRREFTANVSHELKTPLHAISGYAELMKSGLVPPADCQVFAGKIYAETQRMITLVENTLRLSRLDEGAADMMWTDVDLYEAAQKAMQSLSGAAELEHIAIHLEGSHLQIRGIPQLVDAIVFNLTDNAVKYSHPGGIVTLRLAESGDTVLLTVADQGIGIPKDCQDRIFERFYRVDKSRSKEVGGTGLGLSIVKHAASILHAGLTLESAPGAGTTVSVRFPKNSISG